MINLLPQEIKQDYRYARRNRRLVHWLAAFGAGIFGVVVVTFIGILIIEHTSGTYRAQIATVESRLASQDSAGVEKQVVAISNNLKLMTTVLSKEILFSKLLAQLGSITPSNVILTDLSMSQTQRAIDITAQTANYDAATQLQINLSAADNQIFSKADIVSITCAASSKAANPAYPCTANIRAQFTTNNPFLFINSADDSKKGSS